MRASVNNTVPNLLSIPYYCYHFARETIIIETHLWHPLSLHGVERGRTFFVVWGIGMSAIDQHTSIVGVYCSA